MNKKDRYTALAFIMVIVSFLLSTGVSLLSLSLVVHNNVKNIDTILAARIKGAAVCLKRCFAPYGRVYRTGGDEFAAILTISDKHLAAVLEELDEVTSSWSGTLNKTLSISTGAATHSEFPDESLEGLVRISDDRMYAAKAAYYKRSGQQPR